MHNYFLHLHMLGTISPLLLKIIFIRILQTFTTQSVEKKSMNLLSYGQTIKYNVYILLVKQSS